MIMYLAPAKTRGVPAPLRGVLLVGGSIRGGHLPQEALDHLRGALDKHPVAVLRRCLVLNLPGSSSVQVNEKAQVLPKYAHMTGDCRAVPALSLHVSDPIHLELPSAM